MRFKILNCCGEKKNHVKLKNCGTFEFNFDTFEITFKLCDCLQLFILGQERNMKKHVVLRYSLYKLVWFCLFFNWLVCFND